MTQTLISVGFFVLLLALVPLALRWVQRRSAGGAANLASNSRVVSAVAVGQHQRVVTVEVGPEGARVWLTLGVTAQTITCLHTAMMEPSTQSSPRTSIQNDPGLS